MSRTSIRFVTPLTQQQVFDTFLGYLRSEGFSPYEDMGEQYMKKGSGWVLAPQMVKILSYPDGTYVMEGWIKFAILPGVYLGEMEVHQGFFGAVPKGQLYSRMKNLLSMMQAQLVTVPQQPAPQQTMQQPAPQQNIPPQNAQQNIPQPIQQNMPPQQ